MVCATGYTLSISEERNVFACGFSDCGAHGFEEEEEPVLPAKQIPSLKNIKSIAVGAFHSVYLDENGSVFTMGLNTSGQLGNGVSGEMLNSTHIPQKVNLPPCKQISCGATSAACLSEDDNLYLLGYDCTLSFGLSDTFVPYKLSFIKDVKFIECGGNHTFCMTQNNEVYCWGDNFYGQLGLGNTLPQKKPVLCSSLSNEDVMDIKCGIQFTIALTSNKYVLSCGDNSRSQLGRETDNDKSTSFQKVEDIAEIMRIGCGYSHSLCIDINNDLYVFGYNEYGQLGLGDTDNRNKPIK
eukprot:CAMPEP_0206153752 /NCGR_PEP_ID=MMETSP1474-20131121/863_1 /ASSEMBLY_ACC=CAM_ASM_001110 /TAXON_ID=97495 /ORGANISM="Imantonia sp., Strain RCC918" /LENGTH=295 /DNA_ID=CAMNT_0053551691 /DNA_START=8 /DNA_END=892 /DNA_ORIENTATION=+